MNYFNNVTVNVFFLCDEKKTTNSTIFLCSLSKQQVIYFMVTGDSVYTLDCFRDQLCYIEEIEKGWLILTTDLVMCTL